MNTNSSGASSGRQTLVIVLAVIGILGIIAGIMFLSGAANSIHVMVGSVHKGHHVIRAIVSLVVGAAFLVGAYIARSRTPSARGNSAPKSESATSV
jgi:uncharacterized membrane protein